VADDAPWVPLGSLRSPGSLTRFAGEPLCGREEGKEKVGNRRRENENKKLR